MIAEILALIKPWNVGRDVALRSDGAEAVAARAEKAGAAMLAQEHFRKVLSLEQKRAERSERRSVLMHVHLSMVRRADRQEIIPSVAEALAAATRETDLSGWYSQNSVVGVLCTEIGNGDLKSILGVLHSKVISALRSRLRPEQMKGITVSFQVFPGDIEDKKHGDSASANTATDLQPV